MMDLHYYPLDEQNCTVEIESCKQFSYESIYTHTRGSSSSTTITVQAQILKCKFLSKYEIAL